MWSDSDTSRDFLNFSCIAETAAELIVQANGHPLSVGVSGGWGVGKSSMLRLINDALKSRDEDPSGYLFVTFNAWLYQGYDDARAALVEEIATKLLERAADSRSVASKTKSILKRVKWLRLAGYAAASGAAVAMGLPPVGLAGVALEAWNGLSDGDVTNEDLRQAGKAHEDGVAARSLLRPDHSSTPPAEIGALRRELEEALEELDIPLVVLIDDLDRCLPSTSISTLEAIRLFVFLPRTAFIIAADDRMIRECVRVHFSGLRLEDELVTNYFDKLIQVPLRVPPLGTQEVRAYLMMLHIEKAGYAPVAFERIRGKICDRLGESWSGQGVDLQFVLGVLPSPSEELKAQLHLCNRLAPFLANAPEIAGNPRLVKRFLNTLWIRKSVARAQKVAVDESVLAKLLLFERCAPSSAYSELVLDVMAGTNGHARGLAAREEAAKSGDLQEDPESAWAHPFVDGWLRLEPALGQMDLRPAVHVSRETMPAIQVSEALSPEAAELLEGLLAMRSPNRTLSNSLRQLSPRDHVQIANHLLVIARQEQDWGTPAVLHALMAISEISASAADAFRQFLLAVEHSRLTAAIIPLLSQHAWSAELFDRWSASPDAPDPVKNAIKMSRGE